MNNNNCGKAKYAKKSCKIKGVLRIKDRYIRTIGDNTFTFLIRMVANKHPSIKAKKSDNIKMNSVMGNCCKTWPNKSPQLTEFVMIVPPIYLFACLFQDRKSTRLNSSHVSI